MILYTMYKRPKQNNCTLMSLYTMYKRPKQNNCTPMVQYTMYKRHDKNNCTPMVQYTMYKRHEQNNCTPMVQYTMHKWHEQNICTPMVCIPCIQKQDTTTLRDINSNNSNNRGIKRILRTNVLIIKVFFYVGFIINRLQSNCQ
jgi:hypothetical protein